MNIYSKILILSALISVITAILGFKRKHTKKVFQFPLLMIAAAVYSFGYAFQLDTKSYSEILFWTKIQYLGIPFLPFFWFIFALYFTGYERWITVKRVVILLIIPLITFILALTMGKHSLYYISFSTIDSIPLGVISIQKGAWYWIHQVYAYILIISGCVLFVSMYFKAPRPYRRQAVTALVGSTVPFIALTIYLLGYSPYSIDPTPFALSISGVIYLYAFASSGFLELIPISRDKVFENMLGSVFVFDKNNILIDFNPRAKSNFDFINDERIGEHIRDIFSGYPGLVEELVHLEKAYSTSKSKFEFSGKIFAVTISLINDSKGKISGRLLILNDITEMVAIENKLRKNSEDLKGLIADKDRFFSIIAHDLRGPFQGFLGLSGILAEECETLSQEELKDFARELNKSLITQFNFLEELLQWARFNTNRVVLNYVKFDLIDAVKSVLEVLQNNAAAKNISIDVFSNNEVMVNADSDMIKLVIRNLLSNAIKFSYNGGNISVFVAESANDAMVVISDQGVGISQENIKKLFSTGSNFTTEGTARERGSGLGLILCKEIIDKHNGKIRAESQPEGGSKFTFAIPK